MTTWESGAALRMAGRAAMPSMEGMARSRSTTSGWVRDAAVTASAPSPASPTTTKRGSWARLSLSIMRMSGSSSTRRTRTGARRGPGGAVMRDGARLRRTVGPSPSGLGLRLLPGLRTPLPQPGQAVGQQPGHVHLADAHDGGDLALQEVVHEAQLQYALLAGRQSPHQGGEQGALLDPVEGRILDAQLRTRATLSAGGLLQGHGAIGAAHLDPLDHVFLPQAGVPACWPGPGPGPDGAPPSGRGAQGLACDGAPDPGPAGAQTPGEAGAPAGQLSRPSSAPPGCPVCQK